MSRNSLYVNGTERRLWESPNIEVGIRKVNREKTKETRGA